MFLGASEHPFFVCLHPSLLPLQGMFNTDVKRKGPIYQDFARVWQKKKERMKRRKILEAIEVLAFFVFFVDYEMVKLFKTLIFLRRDRCCPRIESIKCTLILL